MAEAKMKSSSLRLVFYTGDDIETGDPIYKAKSSNNVKENATREQSIEIAQCIGSIQQHELHTVERRDNTEITSEQFNRDVDLWVSGTSGFFQKRSSSHRERRWTDEKVGVAI